ncbi:hypothetical protein R4Z10_19515 [Niallia sp. XMNu-256]|uniref:hypothetical protein n=1 Tax=Niallia sp. XMNu-256 TaxID=3082444 RepID=UPI0030CBAF3C
MKKGLFYGFILLAILVLGFSLFYLKDSSEMANKVKEKNSEETELNLNETKIHKAAAATVGKSPDEEKQPVEGKFESNAEFNRITQSAELNLEALIELAEKEVEMKKEGNMDLSIITIKYKTILKEKEKESDGQFKIFLDKLESDRLENGLPASLEEEYKREYEQKKLDRLFRLKEAIQKLV